MKGEELVKIRKSLKLTQKGIAEAIGVGTRAVQYWEKNQRKIPKATVAFIVNMQNSEQSMPDDQQKAIKELETLRGQIIEHYNTLIEKLNSTIKELQEAPETLDNLTKLQKFVDLKTKAYNTLKKEMADL